MSWRLVLVLFANVVNAGILLPTGGQADPSVPGSSAGAGVDLNVVGTGERRLDPFAADRGTGAATGDAGVVDPLIGDARPGMDAGFGADLGANVGTGSMTDQGFGGQGSMAGPGGFVGDPMGGPGDVGMDPVVSPGGFIGDPMAGPGVGVGEPMTGPGMAGEPMTGPGMVGDPMTGPGMVGDPMTGPGMAGDPMTGPGMVGEPMTGPGMVGDPMIGPGRAIRDPIVDPTRAVGDQMTGPGFIGTDPATGGASVGADQMGGQGGVWRGDQMGGQGSVGTGAMIDHGGLGAGQMGGTGSTGTGPMIDHGGLGGTGGMGPQDQGQGLGQDQDQGIVPISREQLELNFQCTDVCIKMPCTLPHKMDCRLFVTCKFVQNGWVGIVQRCAHGTFYAGVHNKTGRYYCDIPDRVNCLKDPCLHSTNEGGAYAHFEFCQQYWMCQGGVSVPKCCPYGLKYDRDTGICDDRKRIGCRDRNCSPPPCLSMEYATEPMVGTHCGTFWTCRGKDAIPTCCAPGHRYDPVQRVCQSSPTIPCMQECPPTYDTEGNNVKDKCEGGLVDKYGLPTDGYCRTYVQCRLQPETGIYLHEKRCCKAGYHFDGSGCQKSPGKMDCMLGCPNAYKTDCNLYPAPGKPAFFITEGAENITMPCSPGTHFSVEQCACAVRVDAPDHACVVPLDLQFHQPKYWNYGSESMVTIQEVGSPEVGNELNGRKTYRFNGGLSYKIDYFKQNMRELFLQVDYFPLQPASKDKVVLVSNCKQGKGPGPAGRPSLELTLEDGNVVFRAQTPDKRIRLQAPYSSMTWNQAKVFYDRANVFLSNVAVGGQPATDTGPLTGSINVAQEGLDIGSCGDLGHRKGFTGDIAKVAASKCLTADHKRQLPVVPEVEAMAGIALGGVNI